MLSPEFPITSVDPAPMGTMVAGALVPNPAIPGISLTPPTPLFPNPLLVPNPPVAAAVTNAALPIAVPVGAG